MNTVSIEKSRKTAVLSVRTISMTAMLRSRLSAGLCGVSRSSLAVLCENGLI